MASDPQDSYFEHPEREHDPLDSIAESVVPDHNEDYDDAQSALDGDGPPRRSSKRQGQRSHPDAVIDAGIGLTLTGAGLRQLLGKKMQLRPKPLLLVECKGCKLTTHDFDQLIPTDYVECHDCNMGKI